MLGLIIYLVVTVLAGMVISFLVLTFRSTKRRGDGSPFFTILLCFLVTILGPFIFVEVLTRSVGEPMEPAIKKAFVSSPIRGKFQYYRVTFYTGSTAKAIVVGEEKANWGGTDRPVLGIDLEKVKGKWKPQAYTVIWSDRLNKDGLVMPPYR